MKTGVNKPLSAQTLATRALCTLDQLDLVAD
jgi:hypothetical protein